jgi:hypothetical protein
MGSCPGIVAWKPILCEAEGIHEDAQHDDLETAESFVDRSICLDRDS